MDFEQAAKIINEYGKVLETAGEKTIEKYPALVFPESLLPYPKEIIEQAAEVFLHHSVNENAGKSIKGGLAFLPAFIDDEEANERNNKLLNNPQFLEALKNKPRVK